MDIDNGVVEKSVFTISFHLLSDTTFGRGDGLAGLVDQEIEHDQTGLPFLRGRTLKGLLNEECANILYGVKQSLGDTAALAKEMQQAAQRLFGHSGSGIETQALFRYGNAQLPLSVRSTVKLAVESPKNRLQSRDIIESLTAIRRQTALDEMGVPVRTSLRTMRVIIRQTPFVAEIVCEHHPQYDAAKLEQDLGLLAATIKAWRRAGTGRNRGRGRLQATLQNQTGADVTEQYFAYFHRGLLQASASMPGSVDGDTSPNYRAGGQIS
ncbi:MAG: hypothetical protein KDE47_35080 [Caldilineaceae bacterium]|nr:hypothetical protein [Caldilineaceae bacterium]